MKLNTGRLATYGVCAGILLAPLDAAFADTVVVRPGDTVLYKDFQPGPIVSGLKIFVKDGGKASVAFAGSAMPSRAPITKILHTRRKLRRSSLIVLPHILFCARPYGSY